MHTKVSCKLYRGEMHDETRDCGIANSVLRAQFSKISPLSRERGLVQRLITIDSSEPPRLTHDRIRALHRRASARAVNGVMYMVVCSRMYVRTRMYAAHALHSPASNVNVNRGSRIMRSPAPRGLQMSPGKSLTTHKDALSVVSLSFERAVIKSGTSGRLSYVPDRFVKSTFVAKSTSPSVTAGYLSRDRRPTILVNFN